MGRPRRFFLCVFDAVRLNSLLLVFFFSLIRFLIALPFLLVSLSTVKTK